MNILNTLNNTKENFLFNDSDEFSKLREDLLSKVDINLKSRKNNESLKHLDPRLLDIKYKYKNVADSIEYVETNKNKIHIIDGKISKVEYKGINNNIIYKNIDNKNQSLIKKFVKYQNLFNEDFIVNLNYLMANSGYEIDVPSNQNLQIYISNSISEKDLTIFQKNLINIGENSKVTIIEEYSYEIPSNNNIIHFINLEKQADVKHYIFQNNSAAANLLSTSYTLCGSKSHYKQLTLNTSSASIRNHHYIGLNGELSRADLDGIFFTSKDQVVDNKTVINHNLPNCLSSQRYKGILTDKSKASYLSKTYVNEIAQKTEAYQLSKGILLSEDCLFHSKPELKIYADDVKCSHGSTIGPIDKDLLFYLRSRGLDKKSSLSLLIKSFFYDIVKDIDDKIFVEKFSYHSNIWLKKNNI